MHPIAIGLAWLLFPVLVHAWIASFRPPVEARR